MGVGMCQAELGPCSSVVNRTALLPQIVSAGILVEGWHPLKRACACQALRVSVKILT
jgi:hypothetical protein